MIDAPILPEPALTYADAAEFHIQQANALISRKELNEGHVAVATVHALLAIATLMQEQARREEEGSRIPERT